MDRHWESDLGTAQDVSFVNCATNHLAVQLGRFSRHSALPSVWLNVMHITSLRTSEQLSHT